MSQEQIETNDAEFLAGFDAVRASDEQRSPEVEEKPAAVEDQPEKQEEPEQTEAQQEADAEERPVLAGLTESQIKALLERSAKVDAIEEQLRKAHGAIGELKGRIKEFSTSAPTHAEKAAPAPQKIEDPTIAQYAEDFPEFVALADARARQIAAELMQQQSASQPQQQAADPVEFNRNIQLALMDTLHDGWRDTVQSQDFALWIATQPDDVRQKYEPTESARELGGILSGFDAWKKSAANRGAKSKERLEQALTPDGAPSRVRHAPSAEDDFVAGFNAIRGR